MPLDAILLTALRRELENSLLGAKIDRISMPEKDVLILSVHSREQWQEMSMSGRTPMEQLIEEQKDDFSAEERL